jgi:hypothetical protein
MISSLDLKFSFRIQKKFCNYLVFGFIFKIQYSLMVHLRLLIIQIMDSISFRMHEILYLRTYKTEMMKRAFSWYFSKTGSGLSIIGFWSPIEERSMWFMKGLHTLNSWLFISEVVVTPKIKSYIVDEALVSLSTYQRMVLTNPLLFKLSLHVLLILQVFSFRFLYSCHVIINNTLFLYTP